MSSPLTVLQIVAVAVLVASALETFRARPWWPEPVGRSPDRPPPRGSSPRERRWLHAGLALLLLGSVARLLAPDEAPVWVASVVVALVGLALIVAGLVRGPSEEELARYREERGAPDGGER